MHTLYRPLFALIVAIVASICSLQSFTFTLVFVFRCLEDQVKSQKSPLVGEGGGAMGMDKEAKPEENAMMLQRLLTYLFSACHLLLSGKMLLG